MKSYKAKSFVQNKSFESVTRRHIIFEDYFLFTQTYEIKNFYTNAFLYRAQHSLVQFWKTSSKSDDFLSNRFTLVGKGSWKRRQVGKFEVRKFPFKLESTNRSLKVLNAVLSNEKFSNCGSNVSTSIFPISLRTFQLLFFRIALTCLPFASSK